MPESETMLGKLLNRLLDEGHVDRLRTQKIDGSKLPDFSTIRRYLGPTGSVIRTEDDGWFSVGLGLAACTQPQDAQEPHAMMALQ